MKLFIVAVPLFSPDMTVNAYNLRYQNREKPFGLTEDYTALDGAMNSPGLDMLNMIGIEPFTRSKPVFVPVNKYLLLSEFTEDSVIPPGLVIFVLHNDFPLDTTYIERCLEFKKAGYSLAISGIPYSGESAPFYTMADYIFLDALSDDTMDMISLVTRRYPKMRLVMTNVTDMYVFKSFQPIPNTLFEGQFYNQPVTRDSKNVSPLKANSMQLMKMAGDEDFDLDEVSAVIARDTSLSVSILRFINSQPVGIKNKVGSIKQAVALLGQRETRKWIVTFVAMLVADDKPSEITRLSLIRAKFAENLAPAFEMGMSAQGLFMMGLFSLLGVMLDKPMESAINEISVSNEIRDALVDSAGKYYPVLKLIYAYEHADWRTVSYIMIRNNINSDHIYDAFLEALIWYRDLLNHMSR